MAIMTRRVTTAAAAVLLGLLAGAGVATAAEDNREFSIDNREFGIGAGAPDNQIQPFLPPY